PPYDTGPQWRGLLRFRRRPAGRKQHAAGSVSRPHQAATGGTCPDTGFLADPRHAGRGADTDRAADLLELSRQADRRQHVARLHRALRSWSVPWKSGFLEIGLWPLERTLLLPKGCRLLHFSRRT